MEQLDALNAKAGFGADDNQYLTFILSNEEYAVEILKVQEIRGYSTITPVPNTPAYIKGVMNLRGTIIPVIDLRAKLDMPEAACNQFTVIIVVNVKTRVIGLVVDAVSDVLNIPKQDIQGTPEVDTDVDTMFINGMAKVGKKLVILLDIEKIMGREALTAAARD